MTGLGAVAGPVAGGVLPLVNFSTAGQRVHAGSNRGGSIAPGAEPRLRPSPDARMRADARREAYLSGGWCYQGGRLGSPWPVGGYGDTGSTPYATTMLPYVNRCYQGVWN